MLIRTQIITKSPCPHEVIVKSLRNHHGVISNRTQKPLQQHQTKTLWRAVAPPLHCSPPPSPQSSQSHHQSDHKVTMSPQIIYKVIALLSPQSHHRHLTKPSTKSPSQVISKVIIKSYNKSHHKASIKSLQHSHKSSQSHPR